MQRKSASSRWKVNASYYIRLEDIYFRAKVKSDAKVRHCIGISANPQIDMLRSSPIRPRLSSRHKITRHTQTDIAHARERLDEIPRAIRPPLEFLARPKGKMVTRKRGIIECRIFSREARKINRIQHVPTYSMLNRVSPWPIKMIAENVRRERIVTREIGHHVPNNNLTISRSVHILSRYIARLNISIYARVDNCTPSDFYFYVYS